MERRVRTSARTRKSSSSERSTENIRRSKSPPVRRHQNHHASVAGIDRRNLRVGMKAPVVYYLSRSWQLDHPHFLEVPISSPAGLFLRDVIGRLCDLRGRRMAGMYSWSCKRSYRSGFVWHDVSEDDLIFPAAGNEYVLKGSEILDASPADPPRSSTTLNQECSRVTCSPRCKENRSPPPPPPAPPEELRCRSSSSESESPKPAEQLAKLSSKQCCNAAPRSNASTQTDLSAQSNRWSPPPRTNTLEALIRAEPRWLRTAGVDDGAGKDEIKVRTAGDVLKQLITCGSMLPDSKLRVAARMFWETEGQAATTTTTRRRIRREWYSGSLLEMQGRRGKGDGVAILKRSSSQKEESRGSHGSPLEIGEQERKDRSLDCIKNLDCTVVPPPVSISTQKMKKKKTPTIPTGGAKSTAAESPRVSSSQAATPRKNMCNSNGLPKFSHRLKSLHPRVEKDSMLKIEER